MAIWKLFSERQADATKSGITDVYQYDDIPAHLRVQVTQISLEAVGLGLRRTQSYGMGDITNPRWDEIERLFCREKGIHRVTHGEFAGERVVRYMENCSTEHWLDLLELVCVSIIVVGKSEQYQFRDVWNVTVSSDDALSEINYRLRQAGVGYQFEGGDLIRVDSQLLHAEVVKPALALLSGSEFAGAQEEFVKAHHHYRQGEYRQAVAMAANSLESTLKAVFDQKGWAYAKGARISDLVKVAKNNQLWPDYLDNSFDQLVATLQSGLPKIRDNDASHGQGSVPKEVPQYLVAYALHLAASKIVFIAEAASAR